MKIISHRGNLQGQNKKKENHPDYIIQTIKAGYDVEIDIWRIKNEIYLGHDYPQYNISLNWLKEINDFIWCHAKNREALSYMMEEKIHCFWHENDKFTLTSKGIPWCYPGNWINNGITVLQDDSIEVPIPTNILGICVDNPVKWRNL